MVAKYRYCVKFIVTGVDTLEGIPVIGDIKRRKKAVTDAVKHRGYGKLENFEYEIIDSRIDNDKGTETVDVEVVGYRTEEAGGDTPLEGKDCAFAQAASMNYGCLDLRSIKWMSTSLIK